MREYKPGSKFAYFTLIVIISVSAILRLYKLDEIPNGFYVDEAAIGYNSYSILKTGKDEYGYSFPIFLRSYASYSSPLYTYLSVLPISIFGLNIFSVRVLSAISGIVSTYILFLVLRKIKLLKFGGFAYLGAFLYAVAPWTVFFSRGAFEANLAMLLLLLTIYFVLLSEKNLRYLVVSSMLLSFSTYAYQANRLVAYLMLPVYILFVIRSTSLRKYLRLEVVMAIVVFILIQIPQLQLMLTPAFRLRAAGLFYSQEVINQALKTSGIFNWKLSLFLSFIRAFLSRLFSYFSPRNLFFNPDSDVQRSIPELSVFYFWMIVPYIVGLYYLFKRWKDRYVLFIFLMLFVFALPASLTGDPFSSLRSYFLVIPLTIIITFGMERVFCRYKKLAIAGFLIIFPLSFLILWRSYFILLSKERAKIWGYGYGQLTLEISKEPETKFVIDQSRSKPAYIELLFYLKFPPEILHEVVDPSIKDEYYTNIEFNNNYDFANIETRNIIWEEDIYKNQVLVGDEYSISEEQAKEHFLDKLFEIRSPIDEVIFVGFRTNPEKKCGFDPSNVRCVN